MLTCWGGTDDYQFKFSPEQNGPWYKKTAAQNEFSIQEDENGNTTLSNSNKKVRQLNTEKKWRQMISNSSQNQSFIHNNIKNQSHPYAHTQIV